MVRDFDVTWSGAGRLRSEGVAAALIPDLSGLTTLPERIMVILAWHRGKWLDRSCLASLSPSVEKGCVCPVDGWFLTGWNDFG
jgi:hypothetical protein